MKTIPTPSDLQPPVEAPKKPKNELSKSYYRRRDLAFSLFYPDVDQTFQAVNSNSNQSYSQTASAPERESDQEILDPERKHDEREFPKREEHDDSNPTRNVPEEDNDLDEDDGSLIKEPTRKVDNPYLPGHGDHENIPSIKMEF